MKSISVVIADDHELVRAGLRVLVQTQSDMRVTGEATDGAEACIRARALRPQVLLLDLAVPKLGALEVTRRLRTDAPETRVLTISTHGDSSYIRILLTEGASGYLAKRSAADTFFTAIRTVASGGIYVDPQITAWLVSSIAHQRGRCVGGVANLSDRELEVMRRNAIGYTNKEIAAQLGVSVKTVETYKARSMEKLGLHTRVDVIKTALRCGWFSANGASDAQLGTYLDIMESSRTIDV